jgi:hypothetical protein
LPENRYFTVVDVEEVDSERLVKLRNPFLDGHWTGKYSIEDKKFWENTYLNSFLAGMSKNLAKKGYFIMPFDSFK